MYSCQPTPLYVTLSYRILHQIQEPGQPEVHPILFQGPSFQAKRLLFDVETRGVGVTLEQPQKERFAISW